MTLGHSLDTRFPLANQVHERLGNLGHANAKRQGEAARRERLAKTLYAELVNQYRRDSSVAAAEHLATADPHYVTAQEAAIEARTEANLAEAAYWAGRAWFEMARSELSMQRAELERLGVIT